MWALIAGVVGFLIAYLWDWISIKGIQGGKQVIAFLVIAIHGFALYAAIWVYVGRFALPVALSWVGWFLLPVSVILLCYSLWIELPFARTYLKAEGSDKLVTTGTYALVRHPWMLWYILTLTFLLLATRSQILLIAAPVWVVMGIIHVVVQDRYFFPRMFPDYNRYKQQTPMLIPNRRSIAACVKTLRAKEALG